MFARFFASRRVRRAEAVYRAARAAYNAADARQDTRAMSAAGKALRLAQNERMAAEIALARDEGTSLRRAT